MKIKADNEDMTQCVDDANTHFLANEKKAKSYDKIVI